MLDLWDIPEEKRLAALHQYQILDSPLTSELEDLAQLAANLCRTPIAFISLIDESRQWFKVKVGLSALAMPCPIAFCSHTIQQSDPFIVEDATLDQRFAHHPLVQADPPIRFYVGVSLVTPAGERIGTLSVIDRVPRQIDPESIQALKTLGKQVMVQLELQRCHQVLKQVLQEHADIKGALDQSSIVALTNAQTQLEATLKQQFERERLVSEMANRIRQSLDFEQILQTTVSEVQEFLKADRVLTYQIHPNGTGSVTHEAVAPGCFSLLDRRLPDEIFPVESQLLYQQGRTRTVTDIEHDTLAPCLVETLRQLGVKSKLVVPILHQEKLWGLMVAHQCHRPRQWQPWELEFIQELSSHVGIAVAQATLLKQTAQRAQAEATLNTITRMLHAPGDDVIIRQQVLEATVKAFDAIGGQLYIAPDPAGQPAQTYRSGVQPALTPKEEKEFLQQVLLAQDCCDQPASPAINAGSSQLYILKDFYQNPQLQPFGLAFETVWIQAVLVLPLCYQQQCVGYLSLFRREIGPELLGAVSTDNAQPSKAISPSGLRQQMVGSITASWTSSDIQLAEVLANHLFITIMQRRVEATMRHQACHDALTDLPNRLLFEERLTTVLAQMHRSNAMLAVMFVDLDHFKDINDNLGHAVGDELLLQVARRISRCVKEGDTVARWGGDEFVLFLPHIYTLQDIVKVAERILKTLRQPFAFNHQEFCITTSIGVALAPKDGQDAETLLKNADTAMYQAKQRGRNKFKLFSSSMNNQAFEQFVLTNDLRRALERHEFFLQYQPQIDLKTGQIIAVEALIRWQHPKRGLLMPKDFIGIAEVTGEIVAIDEWVLQTACAQCRKWQLAQLPAVRVAVNLSVQQLERHETIDKISQILVATGLAPQFLEIEITERVAMQNIEFTVDLLSTLKEQGVHISIDDFGTGHSSLAVLKHFPLHTLKIAREFIQDLPTNTQDIAVVQTIISLALGLNLKTIAEGVETLAQQEFLRAHQCDAMQGYLTSYPLPAEGITRLLMSDQVRGG